MGGITGDGASSTVLTYDLEADAWATAPSLPGPTVGQTATVIDGRIYLAAKGHTLVYDTAWSLAVGGHGTICETSGGVLLD